MKIEGPKGTPAKPPTAEGAAEGEKADGPSFAEVMGSDAAGGATGPPAAAPASIAELASQLRAGAVSGPEAIEAMIEAAVERKGPGLTPEGVVQLRAALRRVIAEDPTLAAAARALDAGGAGPESDPD